MARRRTGGGHALLQTSICSISMKSASGTRAMGTPCSFRRRAPVPAMRCWRLASTEPLATRPSGIERMVGADTELAATYRVIGQMAPVIAAHPGQGLDYCRAVEARRRAAAGSTRRLHTEPLIHRERPRPDRAEAARPAQQAVPAPPAPPGPAGTSAPMEAAAILVASGPDEFYMGGGGMRISFTPNTPGPAIVGLRDRPGREIRRRQVDGGSATRRRRHRPGRDSHTTARYDSSRGCLPLRVV